MRLPRTPAGTRDALSPAVARRAPFLTLVRACHVLVRGRDDTNSYCSIALGRIHVARLRKRERCVSQPRWQKLFQRRVCRRTRAGSATGYSPKPSRRVGAVSLNDGGASLCATRSPSYDRVDPAVCCGHGNPAVCCLARRGTAGRSFLGTARRLLALQLIRAGLQFFGHGPKLLRECRLIDARYLVQPPRSVSEKLGFSP